MIITLFIIFILPSSPGLFFILYIFLFKKAYLPNQISHLKLRPTPYDLWIYTNHFTFT